MNEESWESDSEKHQTCLTGWGYICKSRPLRSGTRPGVQTGHLRRCGWHRKSTGRVCRQSPRRPAHIRHTRRPASDKGSRAWSGISSRGRSTLRSGRIWHPVIMTIANRVPPELSMEVIEYRLQGKIYLRPWPDRLWIRCRAWSRNLLFWACILLCRSGRRPADAAATGRSSRKLATSASSGNGRIPGMDQKRWRWRPVCRLERFHCQPDSYHIWIARPFSQRFGFFTRTNLLLSQSQLFGFLPLTSFLLGHFLWRFFF